jgi:putative PEP-CTERM system TPR-repeat lipoprotein
VSKCGWKTGLGRRVTGALLSAVLLLLNGCGENLTDAQYVERARESRDKGEVRTSIIDLKNALQQNPANVEAHSLLGQVYAEVGDGASAEKELRRALDQGAPVESVAVPLAKSLLQQGKFADVVAINAKISQLNEATRAELFALRGRAYLAQGKVEEAAEQFRLALAAKPDSPAALSGQALLTLQKRQWNEARRWNDKVLTVAPRYAEGWSLAGDLDYQAGEFDKAEEAYTKAIENRFNKGQDLLKRAWVRIELKNYEGAQKDIDVLKKASPSYPGSSYAQGRIYFDQQRFADAQIAFEQELNIYDRHPGALYYLGLTHLAQNHYQQAEEYLKRLANLPSQSDQVTKLLAEVYLRNKEPAKAATVLQEVIKRTPNDPEVIRLMGSTRVAQGDTSQGVDYLKKAVNLQPDVASTHLQLGLGLLEKGDQEEGIRELQKATELDPQLQAADIALIISYLRTQTFDKALEAASRLVEKQPAEPMPHTLLGIVYQVQGKAQAARAEFEQALKLKPDFSMAANDLARLDAIAGNRAAAEGRYRQVLEKDPTNLQTLLGLADLARQTGQSQQAVEWLEKAWQSHPDFWQVGLVLVQTYLERNENRQALELARNLLNANPDNPLVLRSVGLTQLANGQLAEAQVSFRRLIELRPKSAEAWYWLARAQLQSNDPQAASGSLDKALALQPNNLSSLVVRTELQGRDQQFDKALVSARNIQTQYPDQPVGFKLEGDTYLQQRDFAKAVAAYRRAYEKAPGSQAVLQLGNAQWSGGKGEEALAALREWLAAHPQDTRVRIQLANYLRELGRQAEATAEYERLTERTAANTGKPENTGQRGQGVTQADIRLNQSYLQQKEYDKAIAAATALIKQLPDDPVPYNLLGAAYMAKGEDAPARAAFEKALKLDPNSSTAQLNLAELDLKTGDKTAAEARYRQILKQDKGNLNATLQLVGLAEQAGRPEEAASWLEQAVQVNPQAVEPRLLLGSYYVRIGKPAQAWPVFQKAQEQYPNDARVWAALGNARLAARQPTEAVATFRKLVEIQPESAQAHYLLARAYNGAGDSKKVHEELDKALKLDPNHFLSKLALIRQSAQDNQLEEANKRFQELKQAYPQSFEVIALGGELALRQKRFNEAEAAFQEALKLAPSNQLTMNLAQAQWQAGKKEDGIATLEGWLKQYPDDILIRFSVGNFYMALNRNDQAKAAFVKVIEQAPNNVLALNNLAWLLRQENPAEAVKYAERALAVAPDSATVKDTLGMILLDQGQTGRALGLLKEAAAKASDNLSTQYHLALALTRSGDKEQARKILKALSAEQKPFSEKPEAEALLQSLGN